VDLVTIDFETFYDTHFSLSRMTTEAYIRSDQFEVIGVSIKINDSPTDWYSGDEVGPFLKSLDYSDKAILCHHTAFDGAILSWLYGIKPKFWFDTMSMAKPKHAATIGVSLKALALFHKLGVKGTEVVDAKGKHRKDFTPAELKRYGDYCINDTELTYALLKKLRADFPVSELLVIDQLIRMYTEPAFELDRSLLQQHLVKVRDTKEKLLARLGGADAAKNMLMSNPKFASLLEALGAEVPTKISPRTGKVAFAFAKTDQGLQDLLNSDDTAIATVVEARLGIKSTIEETRTDRLIQVSERGPLPIMINYYAAHTGRFGGGDKLNLQNLPARQGNVIRTALVAPEGHKVIACDSSQIEARVLALLAGQMDLLAAFREGRDIYKEFASKIYGIGVDHIDGTQRFVGKTCILGLGYGMGPEKFWTMMKQSKIAMSTGEAVHIVSLYRATYPMIPKLWNKCDGVLQDMIAGREGRIGNLLDYGPDGVLLPNGMTIRYNGLCVRDNGVSYLGNPREYRKLAKRLVAGTKEDINWTGIYGGKVTENVVQALARIVTSEQMTRLKHEYGIPVVLQVHDENITIQPDDKAEWAQQVMEQVMSTPPVWAPTLPVACESAMGNNYGECKA